MGVTSWKVGELMIRGWGVNPGKVMVQIFFTVSFIEKIIFFTVSFIEKDNITIGTAGMISVRER